MSNLSVCVGFLYNVVCSCHGLPNSLEMDVFFDFFGKLDVGVLLVKAVVERVNFVFVNSVSFVGRLQGCVPPHVASQFQVTPWLFHATTRSVYRCTENKFSKSMSSVGNGSSTVTVG